MRSTELQDNQPVTMSQLEEVLSRAFAKNNESLGKSLRKEIRENTKEIVENAIDELALSIGQNFNLIDERFDKIDERLDGIDSQLRSVNNRIDDIATNYTRWSEHDRLSK